jgi:hypothetical protein
MMKQSGILYTGKKLIKVGLVSLLFLGLTQAFAWQMVYHHDANGIKIAGSLDTLKNAIENGHKVRVMTISTNKGIMDTQKVWIYNNKVFAQTVHSVSAGFYGDIMKFTEDAYYGFEIYDTNGRIERTRWSIGAHTNRGNDVWNAETKWFID